MILIKHWKKFVLLAMLSLIPLTGADHIDAPVTTADKNADLGDLYAFSNGDNLVLAMTVYPFADSTIRLNSDYLYQFKIDTSGDHVEDFVFQFFPQDSGDSQTIRVIGPAVPLSTGATSNQQAGTNSIAGTFNNTFEGNNLKVFVGLRDDPFFFDLTQYNAIITNVRNTGAASVAFNNPGSDTLAGSNTVAIIVEFPKSLLGSDVSKINIWATSSKKQ